MGMRCDEILRGSLLADDQAKGVDGCDDENPLGYTKFLPLYE